MLRSLYEQTQKSKANEELEQKAREEAEQNEEEEEGGKNKTLKLLLYIAKYF